MSQFDTFDTPDAEEVYQADQLEAPAIPVKIEGIVQTDEMPTTATAYKNVILGTGSSSQKVLNADPRRKKFTVWFDYLGEGVDIVCLADNSGDAQAFTGAMLFTGQSLEVSSREELWVRPGLITQTGGTWTGFVVSTDDAVLSMTVEQWAK